MASSVLVELQATTTEFMAKMGEARGELTKLGTEGSANSAKFAAVSQAAFLATGAAVVGVGALAVDLAVKFDASVARIQGSAQITQKAAQGIGDAFLHTAGDSTFSGKQMADAFGPVAGVVQTLAGHTLTAADAMKVMSAATDLAEATGQPLASTTADLSQVMQAYGLNLNQASDASNILYNTSRLTGVPLDTLTTTVDKLHMKLGIAAPDLADTGGLMEDLATHGVSGSRGVMVASTAMSTLLGGTKPVSAELKTLGVNIFDSSGKFIGMQAALAQLSPKLADMSDKQRLLAESTLFGASSGIAMNATILAGAPAFEKATAAVSAHDAVQKAAEASSATLEGQIKKLKAGAEDYATLLGEKLIPIITSVVTMLDKHKTIAVALAAVIGGLVVALAAYYAVTKTIEIATKAWTAAQKALDLVMDANPIMLVVIAVAALAVGVVEAYKHSQTFRDIVKAAFDDVKTAAKAVADFFSKDIPAAFTTVVNFAKQWGPLILTAIAPFIGIPLLIIQHWDTLVTWFSNLGSTIAGFFSGALSWLQKAGTDVLTGLWNGIQSAWSTNVHFWTDLPGVLAGYFAQALTWLTKGGADLISGLWSAITTGWSNEVHFWADLPGVITGYFSAALTWLTKAGGDIIAGLWSAIKTGWSNEVHFWSDLDGVIAGYFSQAASWLTKAGGDVISGLWSGIKTIWSDDVSFFTNLAGTIANDVGDMSKALVSKGEDLIHGLVNGIKNVAGDIGKAIESAIPGGGLIGKAASAIGLAEGGVVSKPTLALIGEGGETEYVVPQSKLGGFMAAMTAQMSPSSPRSGLPGGTLMASGGLTSGGGDVSLSIPLVVDGKTIATAVVPSVRTLLLQKKNQTGALGLA